MGYVFWDRKLALGQGEFDPGWRKPVRYTAPVIAVNVAVTSFFTTAATADNVPARFC